MQDNELKNEIEQKLKQNPDKSYSVEKLTDELKYHGSAAFKLIVQELAALERDEIIKVTDSGEFKLHPKQLTFEATFHSNPKGFGFANFSEDEEDAFIAPTETNSAMNADTVQIQITKPADLKSGKGPQAKVLDIVDHHYTYVVGEFIQTEEDNGYYGQIKLKDKKLTGYKFFVTDAGIKPTPGEVVIADITEYPSSSHADALVGIAKQVIGSVDDPGIDILQVVYAHDVPTEFPTDALEQANEIPDHVLESEKEGRIDITDQTLVTIDSESSKDLDDAVTVWKLANGNYHLGVHIADVSHYVKPGSPLDREAYNRGTSVYLTDRVIPMLPRRLSNGICSLNEGQLRLCMSCDMEITPQGKVIKEDIHPSLMKTTARMSYNDVNAILESHDEKTRTKYQNLVPMFEEMAELHRILYKSRRRRGAIDFDDNEAEIIMDDNGNPIDIKVRERGLSERMIESFMLAANETVAEHYNKLKVPFVYRVHETPDASRVKEFFETLTAFGINVKSDPEHLQPKTMQSILKKVKNQPEEKMVSVMMLRSLKQAKYSDKCVGHFGLGADYYTHFTSPIRRYPDTMVHRLINLYEDEGINDDTKALYADKLDEITSSTSFAERRGIDTERDVDAMMKAKYMSNHIGEEFEGVVSSVLKFGMFISLPNTVEGLVHISRMKDDYYQYVEKFMALVGRGTRRTFKIGQAIKVKCVNVDVDQSAVDFEIIDPEETPKSDLLPKRKPKRKYNSNGKQTDHKNFNKNKPSADQKSNHR